MPPAHTVSIDAFGHILIDDQLICRPSRAELIVATTILRSNYVVSRDLLLSAVYGGRDEPEIKIFDVFIAKLRGKLGPDHRGMIETVWGRGWKRSPAYLLREDYPGHTQVPIPKQYIDDLYLLHPGLPLETIITGLLRDHIRQSLEK